MSSSMLPVRLCRLTDVPSGEVSSTTRSPIQVWVISMGTVTPAISPVSVTLITDVMPAGVLSGMATGVSWRYSTVMMG